MTEPRTGSSAPALAPRPRIVTTVATDEHAAALAEFYRLTWDAGTTTESVRHARAEAARANLAEPGATPPTFVVLEGERVIGHVGTLPLRLWDGEQRGAYWLKGLSVLPEYRNGPVGFGVLKEAVKQLPWSAAFVVAEPARRLFGALGYTDIGAVPNFVRVLRAGAVLRTVDLARFGGRALPPALLSLAALVRRPVLSHLVGAAAGAALRTASALTRMSARACRTAVDVPLPPGDEIDALWTEARGGMRVAAVRDGDYLHRRYAGSDYAFAVARRNGRLAGIAIVKRPRPDGDPRLAGLGVATLSDLLVCPDDARAMLATLGAAERLARRLGSDALLCTASDPRLAGALRRQAYVRLPGNIHFLARDRTDRAERRSTVLSDWWVMRGDAESDGAL